MRTRYIFMNLFFLILTSQIASARDGFILDLWQPQRSLPALMTQMERAARLGATHFTIPALFCQTNRFSVEITWCDTQGSGASASDLLTLGQAIRSRGWTLSYFPLATARDGTWRGQFEPRNFEQWGATYSHLVQELALIAQQVGAQEIIVGSEFNGLYLHEGYWRTLMSQVRGLVPHAAVFVVANWDQYERLPFWDASDYIAVSAYYPLTQREGDDTALESLVRGWDRWHRSLTQFALARSKQLYFAEVGYSSTSIAAAAPWDFSESRSLDLELQARLFAALNQVWSREPLLRRILLWNLNTPPVDPEHDKSFNVFDKPAERAVNQLFMVTREQP